MTKTLGPKQTKLARDEAECVSLWAHAVYTALQTADRGETKLDEAALSDLDAQLGAIITVATRVKGQIDKALTVKSAMRIDNLTEGQEVALGFQNYEEDATFVKRAGAGDDRTATFRSGSNGKTYEWDAYRYNGGWAYGTGGQRLRLVSVKS